MTGKTDEHEAARVRGAALRRQILALPEMLDEAEFTRRITAVHADQSATFFSLPTDSGQRKFPAWQIHLPDLEQVLAALGEVDPWMQFRFMTGPDVYLAGRTPIAALKDGDVRAVVIAARRFAEMDQGGN